MRALRLSVAGMVTVVLVSGIARVLEAQSVGETRACRPHHRDLVAG